jgi:Protein of unknown function (DUF3562).
MAAEVRKVTEMLGEHRSAIAQLSRDLRVPPLQVGALYQVQLDRLAESARIRRYLGLIAAKRTRAILRASATAPATRMEG